MAGGKKLVETMVKKHGSYEAWCEWMRNNGRKGGEKSTGGGFAVNRELAREAGRKGGRISRRGKAVYKDEDPTDPQYNELNGFSGYDEHPDEKD